MPVQAMRVLTLLTRIMPLLWLMFAACVKADGQTASVTLADKIAPSVTLAAQRLSQGLPLDGREARSDGGGRLEIYVYVSDITPENLTALSAKGLSSDVPSTAMGVVQGWVRPDDLAALSSLAFVSRITLPRYASPR